MKQMTSEEYVAKQGLYCPLCGSKNAEGGQIDIDSGGAYQEMYCNECDAMWEDHYQLVGYGVVP